MCFSSFFFQVFPLHEDVSSYSNEEFYTDFLVSANIVDDRTNESTTDCDFNRNCP